MTITTGSGPAAAAVAAGTGQVGSPESDQENLSAQDLPHHRAGGHPEDDITAVMLALMRQLSVTKHRLAAGHSGEPLPLQLLIKVGEGDPRRAGDLAVEMCADPSTISRQVALLVRAGLVERRADPMDGRACNLVLTEVGRDRRERVTRDIDGLFDTIIRDWSDTERTEFTRLLSRCVDGLALHRDEFVDRVAPALHLSV